ncbi:glycosyltransferase family 2 protein [Tychonema sp. LEGE 07203]|uniref:glycosyltransferase family 2 protein n=1 Tax=Tychonema sp. LEGE 07203 TaxID=1828671 RepID=UPI00187E4662|nr:glycosyltransferase [Tychonema sp. LEGE 07203]MBE9092845.1 glycosyltransferase [Tychonema sp. LEGE 07203]
MKQVGLVAIGRNEGQRLRQCLVSALGKVARIVYVDSGSTDGSVELARSIGADIVELDLSTPFTAARARNEGFARLRELTPNIEFVQFVDGDCELVDGWIDRAKSELAAKPDVAAVCGRRRERYPKASIYNQLCDIEWDTPIGETKACGGDSMMRATAFEQVEGFNPALIAGEEPEMCLRLRQKGWKILRSDAEMTLHDAQMTTFAQWWKRAQRAGYAYAEGSWMHGSEPERHWIKETRSTWFWGLVLPALALAMALPTEGWSLLLLSGYPLATYRTYNYYVKHGDIATKDAAIYALSCVLAKFPQLQGQIQFHQRRLLGQQSKLIEYKTTNSINSAN